jgi:hypothetical protein
MAKISKRIEAEIKNLQKKENQIDGIKISQHSSGNPRYFEILITGPGLHCLVSDQWS